MRGMEIGLSVELNCNKYTPHKIFAIFEIQIHKSCLNFVNIFMVLRPNLKILDRKY